eukprot:GFKZ01002497.1.p1 GENE.GFKZ01002497.1~~GFKZ01002497.1.p1  ORF type:complete len:572 (-),score=58.95 GFKZ01002497.1:105-1790(-)
MLAPPLSRPAFLGILFAVFMACTRTQGMRRRRRRPMLGIMTVQHALRLVDVTVESGLHQPGPRFKWGGPLVADLDSDGHYDLILTYHASHPPQLFFGSANGTFQQHRFLTRTRDYHGVSVGPRGANRGGKLIAVSVGGKRGADLSPLYVYEMVGGRVWRNVTERLGFGEGLGRGRTAVFGDWVGRGRRAGRRNLGGADIVVMNFLGRKSEGLKQFGYRNVRGRYQLSSVRGIGSVSRGRTEVTDVDGDGRVEIVSIRQMGMYRSVGGMVWANITREVFGMVGIGDVRRGGGWFTAAAVAEADFDNDGRWDLYVARAARSVISNRDDVVGDDRRDLVLRNRGGWYTEVGREAGRRGGVLRGVDSVGVSVGDINNDGLVDVFVCVYEGADVVLVNLGGGRFRPIRGLVRKVGGEVGNHAVMVDYDLDGRVDVLVGHGGIDGRPGTYKVMRNVGNMGNNGWLLVRVGSARRWSVSALHAVVTVHVGGVTMMRRVGSPGAQGGGGSMLETVHFGLGTFVTVYKVRVRWTDGTIEERFNVAAKQRIQFGLFPPPPPPPPPRPPRGG